MLLAAIVLALAGSAWAGVVEGVVVENASGRPLSRTLVRLEPVPTSSGAGPRVLQMRTNRTGGFTFSSVPPGLYRLMTQREGFLPAAYGQRRPTGQAIPFPVTEDSRLFAELRAARMGSIAGRVLDENGVGLPGVSVLAYRSRLPARSVSSGTSDDRGAYRIAGLAPGKYWVRTAARTLDDGSGILPTFGPRSREIRDARVYEVKADAEVIEANVEPEPGMLFRLTGRVGCDRAPAPGAPDPPPVIITISSETRRKSTQASCMGMYSFEGLAPSAYELHAVYADGIGGSGFVELSLDSNSALGNVQLVAAPQVDFEVRTPSGSLTQVPLEITGRRDDLSGEDTPRKVSTPRAALEVGHWEFVATAGQGRFVESIRTNIRDADRPWRSEHSPDWFEVFLPLRGFPRVQVIVSDQAAQIGGTVKSGAAEAPGAPVFLWPVADAARKSLGGVRSTIADAAGRYRFENLPPGDYRVFASFDYGEADIESFDEAQAQVVALTASNGATADLRVFVAP